MAQGGVEKLKLPGISEIYLPSMAGSLEKVYGT